MKNRKIFIISIVFFIIATWFQLYRKNHFKVILEWKNDKLFHFKMLMIISWIIYVYKFNAKGMAYNKKDLYDMKNATKKGLFGLSVALLASLDLKTSAFWLVFIVAYFVPNPLLD